VRRQTYGYLPSRKASPPIGWYQIILLSIYRWVRRMSDSLPVSPQISKTMQTVKSALCVVLSTVCCSFVQQCSKCPPFAFERSVKSLSKTENKLVDCLVWHMSQLTYRICCSSAVFWGYRLMLFINGLQNRCVVIRNITRQNSRMCLSVQLQIKFEKKRIPWTHFVDITRRALKKVNALKLYAWILRINCKSVAAKWPGSVLCTYS